MDSAIIYFIIHTMFFLLCHVTVFPIEDSESTHTGIIIFSGYSSEQLPEVTQ